MSDTVISVENVSKYYRLGLIGGGTLRDDLARKWAKFRGKPDPLLIIGEEDSGRRHGEFIWALRDINLEVKQGEIMGIIGKNGAGKSTLLKILTKITAPTKGRVKMKGRVGCLLEVGTGFHPELTGRENIYLNGTILGMTKSEISGKLDEIIDFSGVELYIDTPVKRYSSGMNVRLAFAVAAHLEPEILLIDEVLAVGDIEFQKKCLGKMKDVSAKGRTVLFVSHNLETINTLCEKGIVLNKGELVFMGKAGDAVDSYRSSVKANTSPRDLSSFEIQGIEEVQFKAFYLTEGNGTRNTSFLFRQNFYINIEFFLKKNNQYYIVLWVGNWKHNTIFWTADCDLQESPMVGVENGYYRYKVRMPKCFFRPGSYSITVCLRRKKYRPDDEFGRFDEILTFDIVDNHMREVGYADAAVVAPEIPWELQSFQNDPKDCNRQNSGSSVCDKDEKE